MGLDIYIQAFDQNDEPSGSCVELRSRTLYHAFNDYFSSVKDRTPEPGEKMYFSKSEWNGLFFKGIYQGALYQMFLEDGYEDKEIHELIRELNAPLSGDDMAYVCYRFTC